MLGPATGEQLRENVGRREQTPAIVTHVIIISGGPSCPLLSKSPRSATPPVSCCRKRSWSVYASAKGDRLYVLETPNGIELVPYDPEFAEQMESAERVMA